MQPFNPPIVFHLQKKIPNQITHPFQFTCAIGKVPNPSQELIDKEVSEGWVEIHDGDLESAQLRYPKGVAVGNPRLVMDSSICGVNANCRIPERSTLPTAADVLRSYPLRNSSEPLGCFSIDIKSAHKRIAVAMADRGFLGFQFQNRLYFYKVCPFGATFSAHYWSRFGQIVASLVLALSFQLFVC